jgi:hypothetical protein
MDETREAPRVSYQPQMIPLWKGWATEWLVSIESEAAQDPDDPYVGWSFVRSDARSRRVELDSTDLSPTEARNLAAALMQAADHAEHYADQIVGMLNCESEMITADLSDFPLESHGTVHEWVRRALGRAVERRGEATQ